MPTSISNLWTPDIWIPQIDELTQTIPALVSSPVVLRSPVFDRIAAGPGVNVQMPYFRDISDQADAIQVENTQPTRQVIGSGKQIATVLNRETANDLTALSAQVSGSDPEAAIMRQIAIRRQKQRQTTLINVLRGLFRFTGASGETAAALYPNRYDAFLEAGASPAAAQLIDKDKFIDGCALLGERATSLTGGAILMHPNIRAALLKADQIAFQHYSEQEGIRLETYKGLAVFLSLGLRRAGTTSGFVYDTYVAMPGTVALGEKPQVSDEVEVASLSRWKDIQKNNVEIYDRTRFTMHVEGTKWVGTPAGQSATNAELATHTNWGLDYQSADRVPIICFRTNG